MTGIDDKIDLVRAAVSKPRPLLDAAQVTTVRQRLAELRQEHGGNLAFVQLRNPLTDRWVKIELRTGRIRATKKSPGPFKGVPVL